MDDLERLRRVTAGYGCLQGLRVMPFAVPLLLVAIGEWVNASGWLMPVLFFSSIAAAAIASQRIGQSYERRYGRVRPARAQRVRLAAWSLAAAALCIGAEVADVVLEPPVRLFGLAIAAMLPAAWHVLSGLRPLHALLVAPVVVLSVLPAFGIADGDDAFALLVACLAVVYVAGGLLDHRFLVAALGPPRETDAGAA